MESLKSKKRNGLKTAKHSAYNIINADICAKCIDKEGSIQKTSSAYCDGIYPCPYRDMKAGKYEKDEMPQEHSNILSLFMMYIQNVVKN